MIAKKTLGELGWFVLGGVLGLVVVVTLVWGMTARRVLPGVKVAGLSLGGMTREEAVSKLETMAQAYRLETEYSQALIPVPHQVWRFEIDKTVEQAMRAGRTVNVLQIVELWLGKVDLPLTVEINEVAYKEWTDQVEATVAITGRAALLVRGVGGWKIVNGEDGLRLDREVLERGLLARGEGLSGQGVPLPVRQERLALTKSEQGMVMGLVEKLQQKELVVEIAGERVRLAPDELISFVALKPEQAGGVSLATLEGYAEGLATRYDRKPQDARFEFANGKVEEFAPARDGVEIETARTAEAIREAIRTLAEGGAKSQRVEAVVALTPPAISTESVNDLGIVEVIGRGESYYAHSIPNRVYNVGLAAERVSGALVPPGGEFSFNTTVGEISAATGYRTAYVIQNGRTELGDGGGVCQVSTTIFRAAMNAGLPIAERYAHAYRVGYYEQNSKPGLDATIFSPAKDFKFKNDTPGYILVQATNDPKNYHLTFELYGTRDGRVATVSEPRISGVSPPPPDLYQDDPMLPMGQVKQVDWAAWGARSVFDYKVERDGETIFAKTFTSSYRPWANVYLRGVMGQ